MDIGQNEWIHGTQKQVSNMRKLVNELIYLSRMDEADSHLERSVFNLSNAVSDVSAPFAGMAEFNGKNLILDAEENLTLCGDEQAVRRLISTRERCKARSRGQRYPYHPQPLGKEHRLFNRERVEGTA